jgi:superfamily II DNA or RNA helicase
MLNDPASKIVLMSIPFQKFRAGAVGINLTQANRVFLMEPSFNPALEAQAIGRIHRLGQKRPVEIVRMVVKNSLEERMVNFLEKKYGKSPGKKAEAVSGNDEKNNESDKKSVDGEDSKNYCNTIAGNLNTDKVQLVTDEFDTLFGVMDRLQREDKKIS